MLKERVEGREVGKWGKIPQAGMVGSIWLMVGSHKPDLEGWRGTRDPRLTPDSPDETLRQGSLWPWTPRRAGATGTRKD